MLLVKLCSLCPPPGSAPPLGRYPGYANVVHTQQIPDREHEAFNVVAFDNSHIRQTFADEYRQRRTSRNPHRTTHLPSKCRATPLSCKALTLNGFSASNLPVAIKAASAPCRVPILAHAIASSTARETMSFAGANFPASTERALDVPPPIRAPALGSSSSSCNGGSSPCVGSTTARGVGGGRAWTSRGKCQMLQQN